jgi:hypothetical protein
MDILIPSCSSKDSLYIPEHVCSLNDNSQAL